MVFHRQRRSLTAASLLFFVPCRGFQPVSRSKRLGRCETFKLATTSFEAQPLPTQSSTTEATITIPPFFRGDNDDDASDILSEYPTLLHRIHVKSILSDEEAARCLTLATDYAEATGCWEQPDQVRHAAYSTCDFAVEECLPMQSYLDDDIDFGGRIWGHLSSLYGIAYEDLTYLDFFCAHYQANDDDARATKTMDRLEAHRDGSLLSFTITLNNPNEFEGGGTFFDALRDVEPTTTTPGVLQKGGVVCPLRAGDAVLHSGKILHGADVVRSGKRTVLVGFVDVSDWLKRPGALTAACRDWGRMDVATFRWKRQQEMTVDGNKGWILNNNRWLPRGGGQSFLRGVCPAFDSVERRADKEFQRIKKLEAEDLLLRSILLSEDEVLELYPESDISIL
jgi:hypothetical protein